MGGGLRRHFLPEARRFGMIERRAERFGIIGARWQRRAAGEQYQREEP